MFRKFLILGLMMAFSPEIPKDSVKSETQRHEGPPSDYDLSQSFIDEFSDGKINPHHWGRNYALRDRTIVKRTLLANGEQEVYFDPDYLSLGIEPILVENGVLTISAEPMAPSTRDAVMKELASMPQHIANNPTLRALKYQSGLISSHGHFAQKYGYFEVRARWSKGRGLWPAIWLLPEDGGWPPEIDIMESLGHDDLTIYHSTHSKHAPINSSVKQKIGSSTSEYHTYGMLWLPSWIKYYIDGTEVATIPASPDMNKPMFLVINLAVGGSWPGYADAAMRWPATMDVDFVRIWKFNAKAPASVR